MIKYRLSDLYSKELKMRLAHFLRLARMTLTGMAVGVLFQQVVISPPIQQFGGVLALIILLIAFVVSMLEATV